MTTHITAIIFDFGNVLLEWNPRNVYKHYFPDDPEGMELFFKPFKGLWRKRNKDPSRHKFDM